MATKCRHCWPQFASAPCSLYIVGSQVTSPRLAGLPATIEPAKFGGVISQGGRSICDDNFINPIQAMIQRITHFRIINEI